MGSKETEAANREVEAGIGSKDTEAANREVEAGMGSICFLLLRLVK